MNTVTLRDKASLHELCDNLMNLWNSDRHVPWRNWKGEPQEQTVMSDILALVGNPHFCVI